MNYTSRIVKNPSRKDARPAARATIPQGILQHLNATHGDILHWQPDGQGVYVSIMKPTPRES